MKEARFLVEFIVAYETAQDRPGSDEFITQVQTRLALPVQVGDAKSYTITRLRFIGEFPV